MTDATLADLARAAGLATHWRDVFGRTHDVSPPTLRAVLGALDLPADSDEQVVSSLAELRGRPAALPKLLTGQVGEPIEVPLPPGPFELLLEDGRVFSGTASDRDGTASLPAVLEPGYHRLRMADSETSLAIAPSRCFSLPDVAPGQRPWGLTVQLYGLRRAGDGGIGDFRGLADFVRRAAAHGASAVAISPVHAQFSADAERFSPYAPSSRVLWNVLHAPLPTSETMAVATEYEALDLLDWPAAGRAKLKNLAAAFDLARNDNELMARFAQFRAEMGDALDLHARFEALHAHFFGSDPTLWHWRHWPDAFRDPVGPAVTAFARDHAGEIDRHAFYQFLADDGLRMAQSTARAAGMSIGLIADLAVGTDSGGSHSWSRQTETLIGLTIGAPPDLLSREGQDWGLVAFSPRGLAQNGYGAFIEMLRAAQRHAGGMRIDHVMGLSRLWVLPEGARANEGTYLHMPERDLFRLVALESARARAVVLGEDLGTVPDGFTERLQAAGINGLRVLWFERDDHAFKPPQQWTRAAVAMTSTHDLATVAGWWRGRDLTWRGDLGHLGDPDATHREWQARAQDRHLLWDAFRQSGATGIDPPPAERCAEAADAAAAHIGHAACDLVLLPAEDALALEEQPNLPGTLHEHPNWRRRLPGEAASLLDAPAVAARLAALKSARGGS